MKPFPTSSSRKAAQRAGKKQRDTHSFDALRESDEEELTQMTPTMTSDVAVEISTVDPPAVSTRPVAQLSTDPPPELRVTMADSAHAPPADSTPFHETIDRDPSNTLITPDGLSSPNVSIDSAIVLSTQDHGNFVLGPNSPTVPTTPYRKLRVHLRVPDAHSTSSLHHVGTSPVDLNQIFDATQDTLRAHFQLIIEHEVTSLILDSQFTQSEKQALIQYIRETNAPFDSLELSDGLNVPITNADDLRIAMCTTLDEDFDLLVNIPSALITMVCRTPDSPYHMVVRDINMNALGDTVESSTPLPTIAPTIAPPIEASIAHLAMAIVWAITTWFAFFIGSILLYFGRSLGHGIRWSLQHVLDTYFTPGVPTPTPVHPHTPTRRPIIPSRSTIQPTTPAFTPVRNTISWSTPVTQPQTTTPTSIPPILSQPSVLSTTCSTRAPREPSPSPALTYAPVPRDGTVSPTRDIRHESTTPAIHHSNFPPSRYPNPYLTNGTVPEQNHTFHLLQGTVLDLATYKLNLQDYVDAARFIKYGNVPTFAGPPIPLSMWYRRFVIHGAIYGIYIPPYESVTKAHPLGLWYEHMTDGVRASIASASGHISQALNVDGVFATGTFEHTIVSTTPDGYSALHNLLRNIHPELNDNGVPLAKPRQYDNETTQTYILRAKSYALDELAAGNHMADLDLLRLMLHNVKSSYQPAIQSLKNTLLSLAPGAPIPFNLHPDQLATTIDLAVRNAGIPLVRADRFTPRRFDTSRRNDDRRNDDRRPDRDRNTYAGTRPDTRASDGRIHGIYEDSTLDDPSFDDITLPTDHEIDFAVHAILNQPSSSTCYSCRSTTHQARDCPDLVTAVQNQLALDAHPRLREQIIARHALIRTRPAHHTQPTARVHAITNDIVTPVSVPDNPTFADDPMDTPESIAQIHALQASDFDDDSADLDLDPTFDASLQCFPCSDLLVTPHDTLGFETVLPNFDHLTFRCDRVPSNHDPFDDSHGPIAQIDQGAQASTTDDKALLWNYRPYTGQYKLKDAGGRRHTPEGIGFFKVPTTTGHHFVATYYTPTLPCTIMSPGHLQRYTRSAGFLVASCDTGAFPSSLVICHSRLRNLDLKIPMVSHGGIDWTHPLVLPTPQECLDPIPKPLPAHVCPFKFDRFGHDDKDDLQVSTLNRAALRILWHNRLGHIHSRRVSELHKCAIGIPQIDLATDIDKCPTCLIAKARRTARSTDDSRHATQCHQGISVDFGFIIQKSSDTNRYNQYKGLHGQTCYILIADHHSGMLYGQTFKNKSPPVEWLNHWLALHTPDCTDKYVRLDQGGDLAQCRAITDLFRNAGYRVDITGAGNSSQNGPVERPHQSIADGIRALLIGADLEPKFWPYAFQHFIKLSNMTPHAGRLQTPYQMRYNQLPDLSLLKTFGCRVYVRPPGEHSAKLEPHVDRGIFLGYQQTLKNIIYYDLATKAIKITSHARFDEGMNDLPTLPPNAAYLTRQQHGTFPAETDYTPAFDLDATTNPFSTLAHESIPISCDDPTFGFDLFTCQHRRRAAISLLRRNTTAARIRNGTRRYTGAFLVAVNGIPVFSVDDATAAFTAARLDTTTTEIVVTLSPERQPSLRDLREPYVFGIDQLRAVSDIRTGQSSLHRLSDDDLSLLISSLIANSHSTDDTPERGLGTLTRRKLRALTTWALWQDAIFEQLDNMEKQGMYGKPCRAPSGSVILRQHWTYLIKPDGRRKARNCCDGSRNAAPELQNASRTYASCVDQPNMRLFFALCAALGMFIYTADATNAYANSPAPLTPTYVRIDDAFYDWYLARTGVALDRSLHLPVQHALQGHPEAGALWERHINGLLFDLGFKVTTHERSLYSATIRGHQVLLCRQVDDLAIACTDPTVCTWIIEQLSAKITLTSSGLLTSFNGVDVAQTRDYVQISCHSYIQRMLDQYAWCTPKVNESDHEHLEPLSDSLARQIEVDIGPATNTPEATALATKHGFSYRSVLGALIYAYVAGRLDIGYAVAKLACHAVNPADCHYLGLIRLCKYLRRTITRGIVYWRPTPMDGLPVGPDIPKPDPQPTASPLPPFPAAPSATTLVGYVDAAYGTDPHTRRSVTGLAFTLCGGAIAYRSKLQPVVATSSTEAEFIAAVQAAKMAKYLRSVLSDLGFPQDAPTPIYCDNEAAILMTNANKPTQRSRHIDIQYYAIQEWMQRGDIILVHIAGVINPADSLTKALGWILLIRHVLRLMGYHGRPPDPAPI